jgi:hypothetical protein
MFIMGAKQTAHIAPVAGPLLIYPDIVKEMVPFFLSVLFCT